MKVDFNIILIGFMGTGKTAVGKRLATLLNKDFYDSDQEVEAVTSMTISKLFNKYGEVRFRSEENLAIKRLVKKENCILATGGGFILDKKTIKLLAEKGIVICLSARPDVIFERVKRRNNRPLLSKGNLYQTILDLMEEREELYNYADYCIDTSDMDFQEIIDKIISILQDHKNTNEDIPLSKEI
ncbi:MAG: shikimate kinase [Clostridia bacterium]|nr:shikimate kinase [Clostridia bacterium]MDD4047764.1 shikimate kinase [Clostridia bacterium]